MNFYLIQEKIDNDVWYDVTTGDLCYLKKLILVLKRKNINGKYRIVRLYR